MSMKWFLSMVAAAALAGCAGAPNGPATSRDTARQLNRDTRYAHNSQGEIVFGPSEVNQRVVGQYDVAGNVHVMSDRFFAQQAYALSAAEVSLAHLALAKASSPDAQALARRMISDHQYLQARLVSLGAARGVTLGQPLPPAQQSAYDRLSALEGDAFDRAYVRQALADQQSLVQLYRDESRSGVDPGMVRFADDGVATLRADRNLAERAAFRM